MPKGLKSKTIKDAIWASYKSTSPTPPLQGPPTVARAPQENLMRTPPKGGTIQGSVSLNTRELLADIRQIIEVCVEQAFAHHGGASLGQAVAPEQKDEVEAFLDNIDMSFILDDDDDEKEE